MKKKIHKGAEERKAFESFPKKRKVQEPLLSAQKKKRNPQKTPRTNPPHSQHSILGLVTEEQKRQRLCGNQRTAKNKKGGPLKRFYENGDPRPKAKPQKGAGTKLGGGKLY